VLVIYTTIFLVLRYDIAPLKVATLEALPMRALPPIQSGWLGLIGKLAILENTCLCSTLPLGDSIEALVWVLFSDDRDTAQSITTPIKRNCRWKGWSSIIVEIEPRKATSIDVGSLDYIDVIIGDIRFTRGGSSQKILVRIS
jgi:hypothetical protein